MQLTRRVAALALALLALSACNNANLSIDEPSPGPTVTPAAEPTSTPGPTPDLDAGPAVDTLPTPSGSVVVGGDLVGGSVVVENGTVISSGDTIEGSGVLVAETREVAAFASLDLRAFGQVDVGFADEASVVIEADDNIVEFVSVEVEGDTLVVDLLDHPGLTNATLRVSITMPNLDRIELSGSSDVAVRAVSEPRLELAVDGSGDMTLDGTVTELDVMVSGSGEVNAFDLSAVTVVVEVDGSGDVGVNVSSALTASIDGSGDVEYVGNPPTVSAQVDGSGDLSGR